MNEINFIYVYSKDYNLSEYGKVTSDKGKLILEILDIDLTYGESCLEFVRFLSIRDKVLLKLEALLREKENFPMQYPDNLDALEHSRFIERNIFGKKMKLFQGGIELLILTLANLLDLISNAIKEKHEFIRIVCFNNHTENINFIKKAGAPDSASRNKE